MKVKFIEDLYIGDKFFKAGAVLDVEQKEAQKLINRNRAVKVEEKKTPKAKKAK